MFTLKCDVPGCNREFSHQKEIAVKRSLGFHKARTHGIPGKSNRGAQLAAKEKFKCKYCGKGFPVVQDLARHCRLDHKEEREAIKKDESRKAYMKQWRETHKAPDKDLESHRQALQKSAWWKVESSEPQPIKLDQCPCCGARFMAVKGSE